MPTTTLYLEHFLYNLYYVEDVREATILGRPFSADYFKLYHSGQEIAGMIEALDWAVQHRDFDFRSMQIVQMLELTFSNEEILQSLETLHEKLREAFDPQTIDALSVPEDSRELKVLIAEQGSYNHEIRSHLWNTTYSDTAVSSVNDIFDKLAQAKFDILIISLHKDNDVALPLLKILRDFDLRSSEDFPYLY